MSAYSARRIPEFSLMTYIEGTPKQREQFGEALFAGLKDYGFIILKDHPISSELLNQAYELSQQLFNLPVEQKFAYATVKGGQRGYTPFGKEHAKDAKVSDLKEFWHVGRELSQSHPYFHSYPQNIWPAELSEFKKIFLEMYEALDRTGQIMLSALTGPLQVPMDYFDSLVVDGNSILRLLHYPPIPEGTDPRCVRAAAHEDINLITLLVCASASGLEIKDRDGTWLAVETDPNDIVVDAGDMLSRITNEVIPSTTHRVVNPQDGQNGHRYSMPYFMHPHSEALLSCIASCRGARAKFTDIKSNDFLMQRLREIGLY